MFAVCAAFAPPLLDMIKHENGGFHYRGASSSGKTTALNVAASVWGGKEFVQRWRATANGLEAVAAWYNDSFLPLDEMGQVDPSQIGEVAYMLANGVGKSRADRQGYNRKKQSWRLIFFSTGEINLAEHMQQSGKKSRVGQEVRIIDIPADTGKYGIFETLHGFSNGAAFADMLTKNSYRYHGIAARKYLHALIQNRQSSIEFVKKRYHYFIDEHCPEERSGQMQRLCSRFALVAAAGELATQLGITGWLSSDATQAAVLCFQSMLNARGGIGSMEEKIALAQVRRFFEQHEESRFTNWDYSNDSKTINRAGFRKVNSDGAEYFVFVESFRNDICQGLDTSFVEKLLLRHGWLKSDSSGRATRSERLPGHARNIRCYRFTEKVLADEE
jgi:putative DNA primase/helicase